MGVEIWHGVGEGRQQPTLTLFGQFPGFLYAIDAAVEFAGFHRGKSGTHFPMGMTSMPSDPQPLLSDNLRVSQSVNEPAVVTPMRLPLRSSTVLMGLSFS